MTEKRYDLSEVEPIGPAGDADEPPGEAPIEQVDRLGRGAAQAVGSTPAVGVTAETIETEDSDADALRGRDAES